MRTTVRWVLGLVVVLHGFVHVLGAAKGLGWAEVSQLPAPIGSGWGAVWLAAAVVTVAAGLLLLGRARRRAGEALVDFFSDDRSAASTDGVFTRQRWSTPIAGYRALGRTRLGTVGEGHWHAPDGEFAYLGYRLADIAYNAADLGKLSTAAHS